MNGGSWAFAESWGFGSEKKVLDKKVIWRY
jgi:hypothetical protein